MFNFLNIGCYCMFFYVHFIFKFGRHSWTFRDIEKCSGTFGKVHRQTLGYIYRDVQRHSEFGDVLRHAETFREVWRRLETDDEKSGSNGRKYSTVHSLQKSATRFFTGLDYVLFNYVYIFPVFKGHILF